MESSIRNILLYNFLFTLFIRIFHAEYTNQGKQSTSHTMRYWHSTNKNQSSRATKTKYTLSVLISSDNFRQVNRPVKLTSPS